MVIPFSSSIKTESFLCFQFQPGRLHGLKLKMSHLCSSLNGGPITVRVEANVEKKKTKTKNLIMMLKNEILNHLT